MKFLKQGITSLTSINISPEHSAWSSVSTYSALDFVLYGQRHYMSVVDSNLNVIPSDNTGKWLLWEVANQYALLDLQAKTATVCDSTTITSGTDYDLTIEVDVTGMDTLYVGDAVGSALTIVEKNVSDVTITTINETIDETQEAPSIDYVLEIAATVTKVFITVTELTTGGYSSLGSLVGGTAVDFGATIYNPNFEFNGTVELIRDPSDIVDLEIEDDQDGVTVDVVFDSDTYKTMSRNAKALKGVPCAWILDNDIPNTIYEGMAMIGYLSGDGFHVIVKNPTKTFAAVEILEVT